MNNLPEGMSEAKFVEIVDGVVHVLAHSFVFGFYDLDDICQTARIFAIEAMPRYNPKLPLENFLYTHVKNRLINFRRDKYRRSDPPCRLCHTGNQAEHPGGEVCEKYRKWKRRNAAKANLMRPLDLEHVCDDSERNMRAESRVEKNVENQELMSIIDKKLPTELRSSYLKILAGEPVSKTRRAQVEEAVREALGCPSIKSGE